MAREFNGLSWLLSVISLPRPQGVFGTTWPRLREAMKMHCFSARDLSRRTFWQMKSVVSKGHSLNPVFALVDIACSHYRMVLLLIYIPSILWFRQPSNALEKSKSIFAQAA